MLGTVGAGLAVASLLGFWPGAAAFSFNTSTPTQCGSFELQWDGGTPPFQFVLVPTIEVTSGRILNFSLPSDLKKPYSYTFDLDEPAGLDFIATMYDANGFGTGGTTPVLTVGSSSNSSCLDSPLLWDFTFAVDPETSPAQCSSQTVTWQSNVTRPVNLFGMIPGGTSFTIPIAQTGTSHDWTVNIAQGTQYLLVMSDTGPYVTGGSSPLITVAEGDTSCMNSTSPSMGSSTTASSATASASISGKGGTSSGGKDGSGNGSSRSHTGAIVGGVIGGLALLTLIAALIWFCLKRRSRERGDSTEPIIKSYGVEDVQAVETTWRRSGPMDLLGGGHGSTRQESEETEQPLRTDGAEYRPIPFQYPPSSEVPLLPPIMTSEGRFGESFEKSSSPGSSTMGTPSGEFGTMPTATGSGAGRGRYSTSSHGAELPRLDLIPTAERPSTWLEVGGTVATTTTSHGVQRSQSTAKVPSIRVPSGPGVPDSSLEPAQASTPTRYVQHEDSGEIVDLPPRYDQLRTRNPDE